MTSARLNKAPQFIRSWGPLVFHDEDGTFKSVCSCRSGACDLLRSMTCTAVTPHRPVADTGATPDFCPMRDCNIRDAQEAAAGGWEPTQEEIDRGADALRHLEQGSRVPAGMFRAWNALPPSTKKKWREKSEAVIRAAIIDQN